MSKSIKVTETGHGLTGRTGWNAVLPAPAPPNVLESDISADWLVIGGGFAGLAAAQRLADNRPNDKTVLLEAIRIGDNSAGRSSGFMIDLPHDISSDSYTGDFESDKAQTKMNRTAVEFARTAAEKYDFSQETFDPRGKIYSSATAKGDHHNVDYAKYLDGLGEPYEVLGADDVRRITGTDYYTSGLFTPGGAMIQPALFVRSLAQGIHLSRGAEIYENSPVVGLERVGSAWKVKTPKGSVTVPKVILAVNGHIQSFGFFKRRLMHIFLYASMTRALTEAEIKRLGGKPCGTLYRPTRWGQPYAVSPALGGPASSCATAFDIALPLSTTSATLPGRPKITIVRLGPVFRCWRRLRWSIAGAAGSA